MLMLGPDVLQSPFSLLNMQEEGHENDRGILAVLPIDQASRCEVGGCRRSNKSTPEARKTT
eukprot:scaffold22815_cov68-Attheya_sp.AAC.1